MKPPTAVRDRDVFQDRDNRIFVTLGYIQPPDRIISILKYVVSSKGRWKSEGIGYDRVFWGGVDSTVAGEQHLPSDYLYEDSHFGVPLIAPPKEVILSYYHPEARLREILENGPKDVLEERAACLAELLHDHVGISFDSIGVAGSILWKGHNPEFSDINMNLYGRENTRRWNEVPAENLARERKISFRGPNDWTNAMSRVHTRVPSLLPADLEVMFSRRRAICVEGQCIGITPVLHPDEVPITHGSEMYITVDKRPIKINATISGSDWSYYNPAIYGLNPVTIDSSKEIVVERVLVYDGAFGGLFKNEDSVEVSGTLQEIIRNNEPVGHQLMIGTKAGSGQEYIRLLA